MLLQLGTSQRNGAVERERERELSSHSSRLSTTVCWSPLRYKLFAKREERAVRIASHARADALTRLLQMTGILFRLYYCTTISVLSVVIRSTWSTVSIYGKCAVITPQYQTNGVWLISSTNRSPSESKLIMTNTFGVTRSPCTGEVCIVQVDSVHVKECVSAALDTSTT